MRFRPVSAAVLADESAARILTIPGHARVIIDGAGPTRPDLLADEVATRLRLAGRPTVRVSAEDFLRPASLRFERGRTDPDSRYDDWLDLAALRREVLDPLSTNGPARVLPRLWDPVTDRSARAAYVEVPPDSALVLDGTLLMGRSLPAEHTVHLWLSPAALARRLPEDLRWTLPAYDRYERDVDPLHTADTAVRADDPHHWALLLRSS